jgi:hypothetical protein
MVKADPVGELASDKENIKGILRANSFYKISYVLSPQKDVSTSIKSHSKACLQGL